MLELNLELKAKNAREMRELLLSLAEQIEQLIEQTKFEIGDPEIQTGVENDTVH